MKYRATSVAGVAVATCGFALAAFIPNAAAKKTANATSSPYTECTTTTYAEYAEYCESTTTSTTTTGTPAAITTSSTQTVTPGVSTTTSTTTTTTGTANSDETTAGTKLVRTFKSVASLKVGTVLEDGVKVIANHNGTLVILDHGTRVTVPRGASLQMFADGTIVVGTHTASGGSVKIHIVGGKVHSFYLRTPDGVSFGYSHTTAQILSEVTFKDGNTPDPATISQISKPHGRMYVSLSKSTANPGLSAMSDVFEFTVAKKREIEATHQKLAKIVLDLTTLTGKTYLADLTVPITELKVVYYPG